MQGENTTTATCRATIVGPMLLVLTIAAPSFSDLIWFDETGGAHGYASFLDLRSAYDAFRDVLQKMADKLEYGLKVLWDPQVAIREIEEEDEDIRRLKSEISSQKGSTYFARMQYGRLIDAALQARSERYVAEIFNSLRSVSVASRSNKPIGDRMIMNAAFLVSRDMEQAFDSRVKEIGQQYEKLTFKYTGPWPPYNFVNIRLKLERAH